MALLLALSLWNARKVLNQSSRVASLTDFTHALNEQFKREGGQTRQVLIQHKAAIHKLIENLRELNEELGNEVRPIDNDVGRN